MRALKARVHPQGFVAQRLPLPVSGRPWVVVTQSDDGRLDIEALLDSEVASWPRLVVEGGHSDCADQATAPAHHG